MVAFAVPTNAVPVNPIANVLTTFSVSEEDVKKAADITSIAPMAKSAKIAAVRAAQDTLSAIAVWSAIKGPVKRGIVLKTLNALTEKFASITFVAPVPKANNAIVATLAFLAPVFAILFSPVAPSNGLIKNKPKAAAIIKFQPAAICPQRKMASIGSKQVPYVLLSKSIVT